MSFLLDALPERAQSAIFSFLSHSNLVKLRLVNQWFNAKCSKILNEAFMKLKLDLEEELCIVCNEVRAKEAENEAIAQLDARDDLERFSNIQLRYKILQILHCEISTLQAVCQRYIKLKLYCFTGGKIIDHYNQIMGKNFNLTHAKNPLESHVTMQLFLLNGEFMDYFEEVVEPEILNKNFCPWFGVKITDILDLYANSNYHISAKYQNQHVHISAKYEILNPEAATGFDFPESLDNTKKLVKLSKYIRNHMRWHNFFYYVDAPYEALKSLTGKRGRHYNKFCMSSSDIIDDSTADYNSEKISADRFKKTFSRRLGNPCSEENVCYGIELQCSKECVPTRLESYIESTIRNDDVMENNSKANIPNQINFESLAYDLILTVKVVIPSEDKYFAVENYVELYHNNQVLKLVEATQEIPI